MLSVLASPEFVQILFAAAGAAIMYFVKPGSSLPSNIESAVSNLLGQQSLATAHAQVGQLVQLGSALPTFPTLPTPPPPPPAPPPAAPSLVDDLGQVLSGLLAQKKTSDGLSLLSSLVSPTTSPATSSATTTPPAGHETHTRAAAPGGPAPVPAAPLLSP